MIRKATLVFSEELGCGLSASACCTLVITVESTGTDCNPDREKSGVNEFKTDDARDIDHTDNLVDEYNLLPVF